MPAIDDPRLHTLGSPGSPGSFAVEPLEPRRLLAGVTLLTHGFNSSVDGWVTSVANAMNARLPDGPATRYTLDIFDPGDEGTKDPLAWSLSNRTGPDPATSPDAEIQILLNWSDIAEHLALGSEARTTDQVADVVVPLLTSPTFFAELGVPLATLPFHLVGHSRGASLVSELARKLGQSGVWVEQVTLLDPNDLWDLSGLGFVDEPEAEALGNTIFVDNYYQQTANGTPNGDFIPNAYNRQLVNLDNLEGDFDNNHSDVPLWYYGTTNLNTPAYFNGSQQITEQMRALWWTPGEARGAKTGFDFSRIEQGDRPGAGLLTQFGGTASRPTPNRSGSQWPNIGGLEIGGGTSLPEGETFSLTYRFDDADTASNLSFFLDNDRNPFNNAGLTAEATTPLPARGTISTQSFGISTAGVAPGDYFVLGVISDGAHQRVDYLPAPLTVRQPPPTVVNGAFQVDAPRQSVVFEFDQDVGASLSVSDLVLQNLGSESSISPADIALAYDGTLRTATFTFPGYDHGVLPNGNYRATLPAARVTNVAGDPLSANFTTDFFALAGDLDRDRDVDLFDSAKLERNFGRTNNPLFSEGDLDYDGDVDLFDAAILERNFGAVLSPSGPNLLVGRRRGSLFSPVPMANPVRVAALFGNRGLRDDTPTGRRGLLPELN